MGSDFRNAYVPGSPLTGAGQIVGLLQFDGYYASDIAKYESLAGLPNVPLQNVLLDGFRRRPRLDNMKFAWTLKRPFPWLRHCPKWCVFEGQFS